MCVGIPAQIKGVRVGSEVHDEVDHLEREVAADVVHNEVVLRVIALEVAPVLLHRVAANGASTSVVSTVLSEAAG
jgi:hydrogenase maturation factor